MLVAHGPGHLRGTARLGPALLELRPHPLRGRVAGLLDPASLVAIERGRWADHVVSQIHDGTPIADDLGEWCTAIASDAELHDALLTAWWSRVYYLLGRDGRGHGESARWDSWRWQRRWERHVLGSPHQGGGKRGKVSLWSGRSRTRMIRRLCATDWTSFVEDRRPIALFTFTLPGGDWRQSCASGEQWKRMIKRLRRRWERQFGPVAGPWKDEVQPSRGAPHRHLLTHVPDVDVNGERWEREAFVLWLRRAWSEICAPPRACAWPRGSGLTHRADHLLQGVHLADEWNEYRSSPWLIAWYFAKHSAPGRDGMKEAQNHLGDELDTLGRWWGVWGLQSGDEEAELDDQTATDMHRTICRIDRARKSQQGVEGSAVAKYSVDIRTGEITRRWKVYRMTQVRRLVDRRNAHNPRSVVGDGVCDLLKYAVRSVQPTPRRLVPLP